MTNTIKTIEPGQVGMEFQGVLPFEEWQSIGERFGEATKRFSWALGDWLLYGSDNFKKRISHDLIIEAERMTGVDRQSLLALATVCRRIPIQDRIPSLSFEHHQAVANIPNEDRRKKWLMFLAQSDSVPTKKLLKISIDCFRDEPRVITAEEYRQRKMGSRQENYVTHLRGLVSVLRKTTPKMGDDEIAALKADFEPLIAFVEAL